MVVQTGTTPQGPPNSFTHASFTEVVELVTGGFLKVLTRQLHFHLNGDLANPSINCISTNSQHAL